MKDATKSNACIVDSNFGMTSNLVLIGSSWHCLSSFEGGSCGFYRCQLVGFNEVGGEKQPIAEIGVPDILRIRSRLEAK